MNGNFTKDREERQRDTKALGTGALIRRKRERSTRTKDFIFQDEMSQQFTEQREAISIDLIWQARTNMSDNKVNGLEDVVVSEVIKRLPWEKIYTITRAFKNFSRARWKLEADGRLRNLYFLRGNQMRNPGRFSEATGLLR